MREHMPEGRLPGLLVTVSDHGSVLPRLKNDLWEQEQVHPSRSKRQPFLHVVLVFHAASSLGKVFDILFDFYTPMSFSCKRSPVRGLAVSLTASCV